MTTTITYLPPPKEVLDIHIKDSAVRFTTIVHEVALCVLAYYNPPIFLALAAATLCYQVVYFNYLVRSADASRHQEIRSWTINAFSVMTVISLIFGFQGMVSLYRTFGTARNLQLMNTLGHLAKGCLRITICTLLLPSDKCLELQKSRWIDMEDYVESYPQALKQKVSLINGTYIDFFILALAPESNFAKRYARLPWVLNQFIDAYTVKQNLQSYFKSLSEIPTEAGAIEKWTIAIHHFQRLSTEEQLGLGFGDTLAEIANESSKEQTDPLPIEVKVAILHARLSNFKTIPSSEDPKLQAWKQLMEKFEHLDQKHQLILENVCFQLAYSSTEINPTGSHAFNLMALKTCFFEISLDPSNKDNPGYISWGHRIFDTLPKDLQTDFGKHLKFLKDELKQLSDDTLSESMKAVIPVDNKSSQ